MSLNTFGGCASRLFAAARTSCTWFLLLTLLMSGAALAEGSRSLFPNASNPADAGRGVMDLSTGSTYIGVVNASQFLYVYAKAGEYIELGSSNVGKANTGASPGPTRQGNGDIYVYSPANFGPKGNEYSTVNALTPVFQCSSQNTATNNVGVIASRTQELAGPSSADGTSVVNGYTPCYYVAPATGIYGVRFLGAARNTVANAASIGTVQILSGLVSAWDVTVRKTASDAADLNGRVFSYTWNVYTNSNGSGYRIYTNLYYTSIDGYRYKQTLQGLDPNEGVFYANASGFLDSNGSPLYHDYRGNNQYAAATALMTTAGVAGQAAQYPLFFNDISPTGANATEVNTVLSALAIPQTPPAPQLSNVSFTGNVGGNTSTYSSGGTYTFTTVNTQTYQIVIRRGTVAAGADPNFPLGCTSDFDPANVCNRTLTGIATTGTHNILWDGKDNSGYSFPAGNYSYQIMGRNGEIHFPMLDIEGNVNGGPTLQKLNGSVDSTVYFDDRGYKSANGTAVGALNGALCNGGGATAGNNVVGPIPSPDHSLLGIDSVANPTYRTWAGSGNDNKDCDSTTQYFGDAKGLDIWSFEKTSVFVNPIVIVPLPSVVDVGTSASATSSVISGGTAYDNFTFFNAGANNATGVTYTVKLGTPATPATCPASVTFTLVPAGVTPTYNPAPACTITFTGMPATLTGGQSLNFAFNYVVAGTNPGPIPLTTTIAATNENCTTSCSPNTATAQTVVAKPIITVAKSASPAAGSTVAIGSTITYTLSVTIDSAPLTSTFTLTDVLGTGLTFGSVTNAGSFNCSGSLTCTLPSGTATGTYTVTYTATVNNSASSSVANNVTPSGGGGSSPPTCNPCSVSHTVPQPNVSVVKTGPTSAVIGSAMTYTLTVKNTGPAPTPGNVIVQDQLPAGVAATAPAACSPLNMAGALLTCTVPGPLAATNGTATITITATAPATVPAGNPVINYAATNPGGSGNPPSPPGASCNTATTSCSNASTTITAPKLTIDKTGPTTATVGVPYSYAITVNNTGSAPTTAPITVQDTMPPGVTISSIGTSALWDCTASTSTNLNCTSTGALAAGVSSTITVFVVASASAGSSVTNTATVGGGGDPGCTSGCTSPPVNTTITAPKLSITKSGPPTAAVGVAYSYTITATNSGTAATSAAATVSDTVPTGLTINSTTPGSPTCTVSSQTVTCNVASGLSNVAPNNTATFTINVTPQASIDGTTQHNTAHVSGGGDPACATDCVSPPVDTTIQSPKLKIAKTSNGPWTVGQTGATYTLTVTNTGTVATSGTITVWDLLPLGISAASSFSSGAWTCTTIGSAVSCSTSTSLAINASSAITIPVGVGASAVPSVVNKASVGGGGDPNGNPPHLGSCAPGDTHCASTTTPVSAAADIAVTKTVNNAAPSVGNTVTFTITAKNNGPSDATGVQVTDSLPVGLAFVGATPSTGSFNQTSGAWIIGALANGASATLTITATVTKPGAITNTATVTASDQTDPDISNNSSSATLNPPAGGVADIQVRKTVSNAAPNTGDTITYTIAVKNAGPDNATGVAITDALPAGLTFVSATPSQGAYNSASGVWTIGNIANGNTVTLAIAATVDGSVTGPIVNIAKKTAENQTDPDPTNDSSGVTINGASADIQVVKSVNNTAPNVGDTVTFTIAVRNNGPDDATNVQVTDALPTGLSLVSATPAQGVYNSGTGLWNIGALPKNATTTLTIVATVTQSGGLTNTATKTGEDQTDPVTSNDSSSVDLNAVPKADLSITKDDGVTTAIPGSSVTYTIVASNAGPSGVTGAKVVDVLPPSLTATWTCAARAAVPAARRRAPATSTTS
jgi:uncharacterized repeat protein (TIGR01451 family)/fimbrial isopeptide formation D2 family protein